MVYKDAVGRVLNRSAFQSLYAGTLNAAQGDVTQARAHPVLGFERQPLNGVLVDERQLAGFALAGRAFLLPLTKAS